jgi:hypothetical protein
MQLAIGLDHQAALGERCHGGRPARNFRREVGRWLVDVNHGLLALLERVVDLAEQVPDRAGLAASIDDWVEPLAARERQERNLLLDRYLALRQALHRRRGSPESKAPVWLRYATAVALASGAGGCSSSLTLLRPSPPQVQAAAPASPPGPDVDGGSTTPDDIGMCEYAALPLPERPTNPSPQDVETTWWAASDWLFGYFDQAKARLPDQIRVRLRGRITPDGLLANARLDDLTGALDGAFLAGLQRLFESLTYPLSAKGLAINYKITFELR